MEDCSFFLLETMEDCSILNRIGVEMDKNLESDVENNSGSNSEEEKKLVTVMDEKNLESSVMEKNSGSVIEDNSNLNSEGVVKEKNLGTVMDENANTLSSEGVEDENEAKSDGSQLGRIPGGGKNSDEGETLAGKSEDMKSLGQIDEVPSDKEGTDGEGDTLAGKSEDVKSLGQIDEVPSDKEVTDGEGETLAGKSEYMKSLGHIDEVPSDKEGTDGEGESEKSSDEGEDDEDDSEVSEDETEEDEDICESIHDPLTEWKKQKELEIYVGRLDKGAVEEDLIEVFGKFGEIQAAKIVKHPITKKSKGFAFIQYATAKQAKKVLSELKDGIEVRGRRVKISPSQGNNTLYMGNICKIWAKEHVLEKLKGYGIDHVEEIYLPKDPKNEAKIKGFALLEFTTHSDAMAAFQRLEKPDAVFGRDRSAKVAFAQTPVHPSEEVLSQVKTVYVEGLTKSWDEEKLKRICKQYGEIEEIKLPRSFGTKCKDFGFIAFTSRESALACVEGINNAQIGGGEAKVKANIAKPDSRNRHQNGTRGGFKVIKISETTAGLKMKGHAKSKGAEKESERTEQESSDKSKGIEKKRKEVAEETSQGPPKSRSSKGGKSNNSQTSGTKGQDVGMLSKPRKTNRERKKLPSKVDGRGKRDMDHGYSKRPSKKPRGNMRGRQSYAFRNPRSEPRFREGPVPDSVAYKVPCASRYAASTSSYPGHAYCATSGSKRHRSDMEPHAGYLEPAVREQYRPPAVYLESALGNQGQPHARYLKPSLGRQSLPHAGYLEPAVGKQGHDTYAHGLRRAGRCDGQGSTGSAYGRGSALPPSYALSYTSYAEYQADASAGGYYHNTEAYHPRQSYH